MKRVLLMTLIFMLSFSSAAFGMTGSASAAKSTSNLPALSVEKPSLNVPERLANPENPDEVVRIIVELDQAPTIEQATQEGVLYKQLSPAKRDNLEKEVASKQLDVKSFIQKSVPSIDYLQSFTTVFNGFSAEVEAEFVEKIADMPGVKAVYESTKYDRPSEKPEMVYSKELVQAQKAWNDYGFRGEGMVVGVIDTGIDPSHKDMVLTDESTGKIMRADVEELLQKKSIKNGKYYTSKVPFGYNYMDGNDIILDLGPDASMHGMHVSGTVGANGNEENGGIKGIAPEAQLLALKVFGNDPGFSSTFGDIYVKAIDDAIKLGADVLNLSLGSVAGFVDENNPEQQAVKRATDNGILVSISAGNSALYGDGYFYPYTANQDYGLTGSPSVSYQSLGVASFENSTLTAFSFEYQFNGVDAGRALYLLANNADPLKAFNGPIEVVDAGFGNPSDFVGKDFTDKIALVSRGSITFVEKGLNAQAAGAAGVIIYNNAPGTINMASDPAIVIPYMSALQSDGLAMKAAISSGKTVTVNFDGQFANTQNPSAGQMSAFSSWGPTPNLDFKPEITAPGGNIFSTLNDNNYGLMSGTSMAAPHVAGGAALIFERVDTEFGLTGSERYQMAKNLLMNTAKPVELNPGEYVSPRRQGAGLMQLANALSTDVMVTDKATGEAKVALKQINNDRFTFTLKAKNYSNEEKTYDVHTQVQMDVPANAGGGVFVNLPNNPLYGQFVLDENDIDVVAPETVTIPANGTADIKVSVDVSFMAQIFSSIYPNGFFVDGFVSLTDPNEEVTGNVPLTVPFFGFNGEWDDAPIFDYYAWDPMWYWGMTALADEQGYFIDGAGVWDTTRFGFSPNGDGIRDQAIPVFSLFRNAKEFKVEVLDANGNKLRTIRTAKNLTKHYTNSTAPAYTYNPNYGWDGMINNKIAEDGDYIIQLSAVIDFDGAKWQTLQFPVKVDTIAPTVDVTYDDASKTVTTSNFYDAPGGTGVEYWEVLVNDVSVSGALLPEEMEYVIDSVLTENDHVDVRVWDSALNFSLTPIEFVPDGEAIPENPGTDPEKPETDPNPKPGPTEPETVHPVIYIDSPEYFDIYNTRNVEVKGKIEDDSNIKYVKVNDKKANQFDGVNFSHMLNFKNDGFHDVSVATEDEWGNYMQITRKIFVDSTAPTISMSKIPVSTDQEKFNVKVTIEDNFDQLRLTVNGDEVFNQELSEPYVMKKFKTDVNVELKLVNGKNVFKFELEDLGGNIETQTIMIMKTPSRNVSKSSLVLP